MHSKKGSEDGKGLAPRFEMWPDLTEFDPDEKFPVPGYTHADGRQAYLLSSAHPIEQRPSQNRAPSLRVDAPLRHRRRSRVTLPEPYRGHELPQLQTRAA